MTMVFLNGPRRYDMLKLINRLITFMSGIICYHPLKVDTSSIYMSASDMGQHSFVNIVKYISLFPDNSQIVSGKIVPATVSIML